MKNKQEPAAPSVDVPSPPRVAGVSPPRPVALETLSPPSPPSRLGSLFPWLGLVLVVPLLTVLVVRQHRGLDLSESALTKVNELLTGKVNDVRGKADAEITATKKNAKEEAESAIGAQTKKMQDAVADVDIQLKAVSKSVEAIESDTTKILENADTALKSMKENVVTFTKAKEDLAVVTELANPLGPKMKSLTESFGSLQEYLESLHQVDHEAVIVICNGGDPTPGRLAKGIKDFVVRCPFPKLYNNYRWTILEKHGTKALAPLASSPKPGENIATDFKLSQSTDGVVIELGRLDDELSERYKATTAAESTKTRRVLILLVSQSTQYIDFVPPAGFQSLNVLLCINRESDPDKLKMLEWMELCRKNNGAFDYVRFASGVPAASAPASSAVDDKQPAAPTPPNAAPTNAATPALPDKTATAATTSSPAEDPQARLLQFLLRVSQPLPYSR